MYKYKEILTLYPVMYMVFFTASTVQIYVIANIRGGKIGFLPYCIRFPTNLAVAGAWWNALASGADRGVWPKLIY